jgi:hypothetical protein
MEKTHTGGVRPRMGFSIFGKAHTVLMYGFLPSADIGQVVYYFLFHASYLYRYWYIIVYWRTIGPGRRQFIDTKLHCV